MLDDRAKTLLKALVERYIADGQPVGSRTLSRASGIDLSPATIRNVMADLEELGLIASPHTSAGRVPTARGYRLFVDTMLTAKPLDLEQAGAEVVAARGPLHPDQPQRVIAQAAQMLSSLSSFVGVVTAPRKASVFRHIEFLRLGERRVLVIIVSPDGDVQNRVIITARDCSQPELLEASNYLNAHYAGLSIDEVRERLKTEVEALRAEIAALMQALRAEDRTDAASGHQQPRRGGAHLHRRREPGGAFRGAVGRHRALRGRRPRGGHPGRHRPHAHALRPHDPDRGHHGAAGGQRAVCQALSRAGPQRVGARGAA